MRIQIAGLLALAVAGTAQAETTYITADRLLDVERGRYVDAPLIRSRTAKSPRSAPARLRRARL